jgi:hypothetical protein
MDPTAQATEGADQGGDEGFRGGVEEPRPKPKGKKGRPKKFRPPPPNLIRDLAVVLNHFFPDFRAWLEGVDDPRRSGQAVYAMKTLLLLGTLMFLGHAGSRNHFNNRVRGSLEMARTLAKLLGCAIDGVPHLDTLEKVLRKTDPAQIEAILPRLTRRLIRMKALDKWRVRGRFPLAIDGTGLYVFRDRHCKHCVKTEHSSGTTTYGHKLLAAFLVGPGGYALPIAFEFIENPGLYCKKQDIEIKAFHRLEAKIRGLYPQTRFHLLMDALYADQHVMRKAIHNGWAFSITFKDSDMPALWREAQSLLALSPKQARTIHLPGGGKRRIRWVNDMAYEGMTLSAIFQAETLPGDSQEHSFAHLHAGPIDGLNAIETAKVARMRWQCENQGFNVLKNGGFALEHVYSRTNAAAKCYVGLMCVAHILQQLLTKGLRADVFKSTFHTLRNYGVHMLEALRSVPMPQCLDTPGQIRLSSA